LFQNKGGTAITGEGTSKRGEDKKYPPSPQKRRKGKKRKDGIISCKEGGGEEDWAGKKYIGPDGEKKP